VGAGRALVAAALAAAVLAGCGGGNDSSEPPAVPPTYGEDLNRLSSPQFEDGGELPVELTCDGAGAAPTIVWREVRQDAVELVFVVEDPDAPDGTFTHWTVYNLPASGGSGLAPDGQFPTGTRDGTNSAGEVGWAPPCPPEGDEPHRYFFTMYGVPTGTGLEAGASPEQVQEVIEGAVSFGRISGTYARR
jgi:Raf kinase inhibitor-like YbhB/YbcL family protein